MSNHAIGAVLYLETKSPARKAVLLALANWADKIGRCWPSINKLCRVTELSERTVQRALNDLVAMGLIEKQHRFDEKGHHTSSVYRLICVLQPDHDGATVTPFPRPQQHPPGVTVASPPGGTVSPNTSFLPHHPDTRQSPANFSCNQSLPPPDVRPPLQAHAVPLSVADSLVDTWNRHCSGVHNIIRMTEARRNAILAAFKNEFHSDVGEWERFCRRIGSSNNLRARGNSTWRPTLQWLIRPENINDVMDGVYDNDRNHPSPGVHRVAPGTV